MPSPFMAFQGCCWVISMPKKKDMEEAIHNLLTCGHFHNFMVELDGLRLHVSESGMRCSLGRGHYSYTKRQETLPSKEEVAGSSVDTSID